MAPPACDECKAILQELLKLVEMSRESKPGPNATPQELAAWFDQREADENYTSGARPRLSELRRRLAEHQKSTGHRVPLPYPPGGMTSFN